MLGRAVPAPPGCVRGSEDDTHCDSECLTDTQCVRAGLPEELWKALRSMPHSEQNSGGSGRGLGSEDTEHQGPLLPSAHISMNLSVGRAQGGVFKILG